MNNKFSLNNYLKKQKFDSEYFGFNIFSLKSIGDIDDGILKRILHLASRRNIKLITCLINPINKKIKKILFRERFRLQDIRLTYVKNISHAPISSIKLDKMNNASDLEYLKAIAKKSFNYSRIFNNYFPEEKANNWYVTWLVNSVNKSNKTIFVARYKNSPAGFIICAKKAKTAIIELMAVHPRLQNQGLGTNLILQAIKWGEMSNMKKIVVSTQAENLSSQIFYQKLGFILSSVKDWYYKLV